MKTNLQVAFVATAVSILTACGGGGGGGTSTTAASAVAEGVWSGTSSSGYALNTLVLENGSTYNLFGNVVGNVFGIVGFDQGTIAVSGSSISGQIREYANNGTSSAGSVSGTVNTATSINGATVFGATTTTFSLTPINASTYNYSATPRLSDVAGGWAGTMLDGTSATVSLNGSTGAITGTHGGCSFTGTSAYRASGKNVFDVTVTFGGAPCSLPGVTATGIAINYGIAGTALRQLVVALQDPTKAYGALFIATR